MNEFSDGYYVTPEEIASIPLKILHDFEKICPSSPWRALDEEREYAQKLRSWPSYAFADQETYQLAVAAVHGIAADDEMPIPHMLLFQRLASDLEVLGPWRITRGIYCFDSELSNAIADTDPAGVIPVEILQRLPEWAVCIFGEGLARKDPTSEDTIICSLASIVYDRKPNIATLRILNIHKDFGRSGGSIDLLPGKTVESSLTDILASMDNISNELSDELPGIQADIQDVRLNKLKIIDHVSRVVAHLLYLCADEPDMESPPPRPTPQKTKKGSRFFPPNKGERIIQVGARFGAMFRRTRAQFTAAESNAKIGRTMPPHWRKAHWAHFWVGPRKSENRSQIIKWIAPTFVNATVDELPVVVRPVL